jgi:hypothetical protein
MFGQINGARGAADRDAKKIMKMKIFHRKLGAKFSDYCFKNGWGRSYDNNVINIRKDTSRGVIMMKNGIRGIIY